MRDHRAATIDEIRRAAFEHLANRNLHEAVAALDRYVETGDAAVALHDLLDAMLHGCSIGRVWSDPMPGKGSYKFAIDTPYLPAQRAGDRADG